MRFDPKTKAWILLVSLVTGTGIAAAATAYAGGAKLGWAIAIGIGVAGSNVYHALSASPSDKADNSLPADDQSKTRPAAVAAAPDGVSGEITK